MQQLVVKFGIDLKLIDRYQLGWNTRIDTTVENVSDDEYFEDFTQGTAQYDVIFDLSGNHSLSAYRRVLAPTGIYIMGGDTDKGAWLGPLKALGKTLLVSKFVKQTMSPFFASLDQADLVVLADMMQAGKVKAVIDRRYSLDQVADAFRYQLTGHARGKVIVTVD